MVMVIIRLLKGTKMKRNEFIKKAGELGYTFEYDNERKATVWTANRDFTVDEEYLFTLSADGGIPLFPPLIHLMVDYSLTPLKEREDEQLYTIRLCEELDSQEDNMHLNVDEYGNFLGLKEYATQFKLKDLEQFDFIKKIGDEFYFKAKLELVEDDE
jgi:hypothetical protein